MERMAPPASTWRATPPGAGRRKATARITAALGAAGAGYGGDRKSLAQDKLTADGALVETAEVTNTGKVGGEEVAQLHVGARSSKVERAPKELKAFTKVSLAPGETRTGVIQAPGVHGRLADGQFPCSPTCDGRRPGA
jgi:hypothetical protein